MRIALMGAALMVVGAVGSVAAQQPTAARPAFEFRGLRFGDSVPKSKGFLRGNGLHCDQRKEAPGAISCDDLTGIKIAGIAISSPLRGYLDQRLYDLYMSFDSSDYDGLVDAFTTRYGKPDSTATEDVHNRMNASFKNELKLWRFSDGELRLERYGSTVTEGDIVARSTDGFADYERRRKEEAARAAAKDFGAPGHNQ